MFLFRIRRILFITSRIRFLLFGGLAMPCYLVERTFCEQCSIPEPGQPQQTQLHFIENNTRAGVLWVKTYISPDRKKSYCLYEAPSPGALRQAAKLNRLPVDRIIEINLLDPAAFPYQDE